MASTGIRSVMALIIGASLMSPLALATSAQAEEGRIPWSQLTKQLEDKGYNIRELDQKRDGWKAEVTNQKGERLDLRIDRQGVIVREEIDD